MPEGGQPLVYNDEMMQLVEEKYPLCSSKEDRQALAAEIGLDSIQKLYNLASRLKANGFPIGLPPVKGVTFTRQGLSGHLRKNWMTADRRFIFSKTADGKRWQLRAAPGGLEFDRQLMKVTGLNLGSFSTRRSAYEALQLTLAAFEEEMAAKQLEESGAAGASPFAGTTVAVS